MTIAPQRPAGRHAVPNTPPLLDGSQTPRSFRLLYVCTGNVCRSPAAELLTRHLLIGRLGGREAGRIEVASAGVRAVVGAPVHPMMRAQLAPWGLDGARCGQFVARSLDASVVHGADLVLGATPRHRSSVLEQHPELLGKVFSLREFARLSTRVDPLGLPRALGSRAWELVDQARRLRGTVGVADDRIPDPMGGTEADFEHAAMLTFEAIRTMLDVLAPRRLPAAR